MNGTHDDRTMPILTSDTEAPWAELPELPAFDAHLRAEMESIQHYHKPALTIDNASWRLLGQILARHQCDMEEVTAIRATTEALTVGGRGAVDKKVLGPLRRARSGLASVLRIPAIRARIERASRNGPVTEQLAEVIRAIEEIVLEEDRSPSAFVDDAPGRLESSLRVWWDRRSSARSGGGRASNKDGSEPAYHQFLRLCFGVLDQPPGSAYDALKKHRDAVSRNEASIEAVAANLRRISETR